jgi:hypothetical protein
MFFLGGKGRGRGEVRTGGNVYPHVRGVVLCASWSSRVLEYCLPLVRCGGEDEDGGSAFLLERCGCDCREDREALPARGPARGLRAFARERSRMRSRKGRVLVPRSRGVSALSSAAAGTAATRRGRSLSGIVFRGRSSVVEGMIVVCAFSGCVRTRPRSV